METLREFLISLGQFAGTWTGFGVIFAICFVILGLPVLRQWLTECAEYAGLGIADEEVPQKFRVATTRSEAKGESAVAECYTAWVRQEDWSSVHAQIARDDASLAHDPVSDMRAARVGVEMAMADIHQAVGHGGEGAEERALTAVDGFVARMRAAPHDLAAAVLAAEAHMEIGWMYRGGGTSDTVSAYGWQQMHAHFDQAYQIMREFEVARRGSAVLAAANFRLAVGMCHDDDMVFHAAKAIWMKTDPSDPGMMRQVAFHLLPRWYGEYRDLHLAAAEIASLTPEMGDQAYAMTVISMGVEEPELVEAVDVARLQKGAMEWIDASDGNQDVINQIVAGLFYMMLEARGARRKALRAALRMLFETKVRALVMDFWPDTLADIRMSLAQLFGKELSAGGVITIDQDGYRLIHPESV